MSDKVALVTGAGRGIGLGITRRFLEDGWRVAMLDVDADALGIAHAELATAAAAPVVCDVSEPEQVTAAVARAVDTFSRLDALVNNAGIASFQPLLETSVEEWSRILAVNLTGPFLMVREAAPVMGRGGAVVNIGSISGMRASTLRVAYGTSKAGLAHLTRQQAVELAELGIRVNLVAPGPVETDMAKAVHTPEIRADYHDAIPLNRYGTVGEIADAVVFLCGDGAGYITGQCLGVDGGFQAAGIGLPTLRRSRDA